MVTVQAIGVLLAAVLAGIAAIEGKSYQNASGIAITAIGVGAAIGLGYVAFGLAKTRRWSRTPALLTQLFTGIIGIYLVLGGALLFGTGLFLSLYRDWLLALPAKVRRREGIFRIFDWR